MCRRLAALKRRATDLRGRKAHLEYDLDQPPQPLVPADLTQIRDRVVKIMEDGSPNARKAMFEALIDEIIVVADDTIRPVFRLHLGTEDTGHQKRRRTGPRRAGPLREPRETPGSRTAK